MAGWTPLHSAGAESLHPPCDDPDYLRACTAFAECAELHSASDGGDTARTPAVTAMLLHHAVNTETCGCAKFVEACGIGHYECAQALLFRAGGRVDRETATEGLRKAVWRVLFVRPRQLYRRANGVWAGVGDASLSRVFTLLCLPQAPTSPPRVPRGRDGGGHGDRGQLGPEVGGGRRA